MTNDYDKASKAFYEVKDGIKSNMPQLRSIIMRTWLMWMKIMKQPWIVFKVKDSEAFAPVVPFLHYTDLLQAG